MLTGLVDLRPIRSEEEKAVEEMLAVTDEHLSPEDTCRALYRAGYRKPEQVNSKAAADDLVAGFDQLCVGIAGDQRRMFATAAAELGYRKQERV